jgi:hypothetical protein
MYTIYARGAKQKKSLSYYGAQQDGATLEVLQYERKKKITN